MALPLPWRYSSTALRRMSSRAAHELLLGGLDLHLQYERLEAEPIDGRLRVDQSIVGGRELDGDVGECGVEPLALGLGVDDLRPGGVRRRARTR